ncbi:hypothetical protein [Streptomyces radicis]|uniref:Uncharacterized protein n=1 Tax=Streptomyces radicis TaxID=1750517 RepID=A0A3A9WDW5_9ACTN|nr:hypothetical protein [Streptomyces radicis]RKN11521.1 hypothetical protein D7319_06200 [Streptomyces radicis]RKN26460.1 hypothetical protein D7318_03460 [Streptomyces radicis]
MVRKKMEGNEEQRRRAARDAERSGERPSETGSTTGGSKQRTHVPDRSSLSHEERTAPLHQGKQRHPGPGRERREPPPERTFGGRAPDYGPEHERVFRALGDAQRRHAGRGVYVDEVARGAGLPRERTRVLLHDLVSVHRLATELQGTDRPDQGPRFETKPGR